MSAERANNVAALPFQAPQNNTNNANNNAISVNTSNAAPVSDTDGGAPQPPPPSTSTGVAPVATSNSVNNNNSTSNNNPNNNPASTTPAASPSQSRPNTGNIYPLRESAFGPPLSATNAPPVNNPQSLPPIDPRAALSQPQPYPLTPIAAPPAVRAQYNNNTAPQSAAVYANERSTSAAPSNRLAPHPEPAVQQQQQPPPPPSDQPTQQPPQPPVTTAESAVAAAAVAQQPPPPPPPPPSRASLPMGLTLQTASSRILQSVHSLQRMPHGAPPNPHLSCNLLLPDGRPLVLHHQIPSLPQVPHQTDQLAPAPVQGSKREPVLHSQQQDYRPNVQQQVRDTRHLAADQQQHPSNEYGVQHAQQSSASNAGAQGGAVYNIAQPQKSAGQQLSRAVQQVRETQQQINDTTRSGANNRSPINTAGGGAQGLPAASSAQARTDVGDRRTSGDVQTSSGNHMEVVQDTEPRTGTMNVLEMNGAVQNEEAGQRRQLKVEDALAYLERVKMVFGNQPNVYNNFLDIMKAFKAQTIDTIEVIVRVSQLFQGNDHLILGFNRFLPPGYKIQIIQDKETGTSRAGFEGPKGYSTLNATTTNNMHLKPIAPHPNAGAGSSAQGGANSDRITPQQQQQRQPVSPVGTADRLSVSARANSPRSPRRQTNVGTPPPLAAADEEDVTMADIASSPGAAPGPAEASRQQMTDGFRIAISLLQDLKNRRNGEELFESFIKVTNRFRDGKGCETKKASELYAATAELLREHKDLLERFNQLLPVFYRVTSNGNLSGGVAIPERTDGRRGGRRRSMPNHPPEVAAFKRIRDVLGPRRAALYNEFLKMVRLLTNDIVSPDEFRNIVEEMFKGVPRALEIFDECLANAMSPEYGTDADEEMESASEEEEVEVDPLKMAEYKTKSMSEVASESTNIVGASYRALPKGYPQPVCSGRNALERATLNDHWVSTTQGSEDHTKFFMRKNTYEDNLYRCEDDRYELDMIIESNMSTIMAIEPIAVTISRLPTATRDMHALVDGALNPIHYSAIQRIYGDKGVEVVQQVKLNPYAALPIVLQRLKEKDVSWRKARIEMNKIWRDVGETNYYRGVDHRTLQFKGSDKKELSTKTLLGDVVDPANSLSARDAEHSKGRGYPLVTSGGVDGVVNDRSRAVEAVVKAAAAGAPYVLYLSYNDDAVHRVAYELIGMQIHKDVHDSSTEKKVMKSFKKLIASFFGLSFDDDDKRDYSDTPTILFGDETLYLMFRLYDILYERLARAKELAETAAKDQRTRNGLNEKGKKGIQAKSHIPKTETYPSELVQAFTATKATKYFSVQPLATEASKIFNEFVSQFKSFFNKALNTDQYEDCCRVLLGPNSFVLHTLDKTLQKTGNSIVKSCGPESATRTFIDMYHESRSRHRGAAKQSGPHTNRGFEELSCEAAAKHLRKEKGTGAILYRLQFVKREVNKGILAVSTFGRTASEEEEKLRMAVAEKLDGFLGFSGSCETATAKNKKNEGGKDGGSGDNERKEKDSSKKRKGSGSSKDSSAPRKRVRNVGQCRPTFRKRHINVEKVRDKNLQIENGLEMKLAANGGFTYTKQTYDILMNRGRTLKKINLNKKYGKMKYEDEKISALFRVEANEREKSTSAMDENRTESSSGSTPQSDMEEKKDSGAMVDDEVAGETAEESEGEGEGEGGGNIESNKEGKASGDKEMESEKKKFSKNE